MSVSRREGGTPPICLLCERTWCCAPSMPGRGRDAAACAPYWPGARGVWAHGPRLLPRCAAVGRGVRAWNGPHVAVREPD